MDPAACRPYPDCSAQPSPEVCFASSEAVSLCLGLARRWSQRGGDRSARWRSSRAGSDRAAAMAGSEDLFDAIVMADDRFRGEGYQEGYEEGSSLGIIEGRQHGTLYGAKIGSEIGCYQGFAFAWRCLLHGCATEKDSKKMKVLESLIRMIEKFPYADPAYARLHEDLDRIRGKFKQLCSLLNVQPDFKISGERSGLSF